MVADEINQMQSLPKKSLLPFTEEQKAKYLPGVASGDTCICICMTEAEHGSDLAHIETSAVKDGKGNYIVNGGKIYISNGILSSHRQP